MGKKVPGAISRKGKGSKQEMLPSRAALSNLVKGDPMQRTLGQYAKATPTMDESPSMVQVASVPLIGFGR